MVCVQGDSDSKACAATLSLATTLHTTQLMSLGMGTQGGGPCGQLCDCTPLHLVNGVFSEGVGVPEPNIELVRA